MPLPCLREPAGCGPSSGSTCNLGPHHFLCEGLSVPILTQEEEDPVFPNSEDSLSRSHKYSRPSGAEIATPQRAMSFPWLRGAQTSKETVPPGWVIALSGYTQCYVHKRSLMRTYCIAWWWGAGEKAQSVYRIYVNLQNVFQYTLGAAAAAKSLQSCPTLYNSIEGSPPGSPVPGILRQEQRSGLPFPSPMHESEK